MVTVLLFGARLQQEIGEMEFQFEVEGPTTVRALIEAHEENLGPLLSMLDKSEVMVTVNRKVAVQGSPVKDGDTVRLTYQVHHSYEGARWQNP